MASKKSFTAGGINRREFLRISALTGAVLLTGCKPAAPTPLATQNLEIDFTAYSYCGLRCKEACPEGAYPDRCQGCKADCQPGRYCQQCSIRPCAADKELPTCAHCEDYPTCDKVEFTRFPILRRELDALREKL
jgi:hypothetical protein